MYVLREGKPAARHMLKGSENMAHEHQGKFLSVAEVADIMRVSKMTVYRLIHAGEMASVRVGRSFRVPEKAVKDYLDSSYYEVG